MCIVLVDNNVSAISILANELAALFPQQFIQSFTDPLLSAKYICNNEVDLAVLTAEMRPVDGFILLRTLRINKPWLPVVMLLSSEQQVVAAIGQTPTRCLIRPVTAKSLEGAVKQLLLVY